MRTYGDVFTSVDDTECGVSYMSDTLMAAAEEDPCRIDQWSMDQIKISPSDANVTRKVVSVLSHSAECPVDTVDQ